MGKGKLRVAVDIGGTFTDLVVFDEATGQIVEAKASTTPVDFSRGVIDAIVAGGIAPAAIATLVHGTTVVINAITQRRGVTTALVTTEGFRDALAIGRGNRPDMYNLKFHKPEPFVPRRLRFEVRERVAADGAVRTPLHMADLETVVQVCRDAGVEAVAICFLHAYAYPAHEEAAADYLREHLPGVAFTTSSSISREWREYERSSTAVLNAYVQPILDRYLGNLEERLHGQQAGGHRFAMLSNGGTATFDSARKQPIQLVESGPAAGIIGAALVGERIGEPNVISLDIGGTTAKCSLIEGGEVKISADYRLERTIVSPGYPVQVPVVDIVEIGAGGGSIAWFDEGGALKVGPVSAGAEPGPACYGRGGTAPTVTDAMLIAGVLDPTTFLGGQLPLDIHLARVAYRPLAERLNVSIEEAAAGVIRLVNEMTIDALKLISVRRGYDPRDFALVAFGGGGPMHAAVLGAELGVKRIIIPPFPGTFSAWGMLVTRPRIDLTRTYVVRLDRIGSSDIDDAFIDLEKTAIRQFLAQGFGPAAVVHRRSIDLRYHGQEHTVRVPVESGGFELNQIEDAFHDHHRRRYTFALAGTTVEIVNFRLTSMVDLPRPEFGRANLGVDSNSRPRSATRRSVHLDGVPMESSVYSRESLPSGFTAEGPLIVEEPSATTLVCHGQRLRVDEFGNLVIIADE